MILETFLHGNHAHVNSDKPDLYNEWRSRPASLMFESVFEGIVADVTKSIYWLAKMNETAILALEKQVSSPDLISRRERFMPPTCHSLQIQRSECVPACTAPAVSLASSLD
jgi:hypothetical protein